MIENNYVQALTAHLAAHANPDDAAPMARYMRDQFPFLGIKTPQRRALLGQFVSEHGLPPVEQLAAIVLALWQLPEREYQYAALGLLHRQRKQLAADAVDLLETLIVTKSWWDTVDSLAGDHVGALFQRHPVAQANCLIRWRQSDNIWLRRTAILFQLKYKGQTNAPLLFAIVEENLGSSEFFINKAIGWALREYSKTDATAVLDFVARTDLASLSRREALKWLKNQEKLPG